MGDRTRGYSMERYVRGVVREGAKEVAGTEFVGYGSVTSSHEGSRAWRDRDAPDRGGDGTGRHRCQAPRTRPVRSR
jgi:hypothetical protein